MGTFSLQSAHLALKAPINQCHVCSELGLGLTLGLRLGLRLGLTLGLTLGFMLGLGTR